MKFAWIEDEKIRDIAHDDPNLIYHPNIAKFYDTQVPDEASNGDGWVNGAWVKAPPPAPLPPPPRMWTVELIRSSLTMLERVKWDNDKSDFIKTAKIELAYPQTVEPTTEILQMLVDAGDISQATMQKILS